MDGSKKKYIFLSGWKYLGGFISFIRVQERVSHSGLAGPWEHFRTRLASAHVSHSGFMPRVANLGGVTTLRPLL